MKVKQKTKRNRIQIYPSDELMEMIEKQAKRELRNIANYCEFIIDKYVREYQRHEDSMPY